MLTTVLTPRGLIRRIKRHLLPKRCEFAAATLPGLEKFLAEEISALEGATVDCIDQGVVEFSGRFDLAYTSNLHLRTANRIILRIARFTARSYPELYNKLHRIRWEIYIGFAPSVFFESTSRTSRLHHTDRIAETAFEAVSGYMSRFGLTIGHDRTASIRFFIRFRDDICTVSADSSGELLYKRGYRRMSGRAPLRETVAAALLKAASWEKYDVIADPCCGTGAIILEALHMACNMAAGANREFALFTWPSFNKGRWEQMIKKAYEGIIRPKNRKFIASDIDTSAVKAVRENSAGFPLDGLLTIEQADCLNFNDKGRYGQRGLIISNLPFGKRIKTAGFKEDLFYRKLGLRLKKSCRGWNFAFLVADPQFEMKAGLECRTALLLNNGGIKARFVLGTIGNNRADS